MESIQIHSFCITTRVINLFFLNEGTKKKLAKNSQQWEGATQLAGFE